MTPQEWDCCADPGLMGRALRAGGELSDRKWRLFTCGCCRLVRRFAAVPALSQALDVAERHADGRAAVDELRDPRSLLPHASGDTAAEWFKEALAGVFSSLREEFLRA